MPKPSPKLKTVVFALDELTIFHKNARRGDTDAIAESLSELDQFRTIVVNAGTHTGRTNEVLAGNHTLKAARLLGWEHIEATVVDYDEVRAAKVVAADNRTNDLASYDTDALIDLLESIGRENLIGTGYDLGDYDGLIDEAGLPEPLETGGTGAGSGERATTDSLTWGYVQWAATRVRITTDEVAAFDVLYEGYIEATGTAAGFGWHLIGLAKDAEATALAGQPADPDELTGSDEA